jgi:hypothetical protein
MHKATKTAVVITLASALTLPLGHGWAVFNDLAPSTIAATAATANSSNSSVAMVYNTITDEPIEIATPERDVKSQS